MNPLQNNITVRYSGEYIELKTALIGGKVDDFDEDITGIYGGPLDLDEIHTTLYSAVRAVVTLLTQEFKIPLEQVDNFIFSAVNEALVKEWNNKDGNDSDMAIKKIVKRYRKNQF